MISRYQRLGIGRYVYILLNCECVSLKFLFQLRVKNYSRIIHSLDGLLSCFRYFTTPGSRVFDVKIETMPVINKLDIVDVAGYATAYSVSFTTSVIDGFATIELIGFVENPTISAIEVIEASGPPSTLAPTVDPGFQYVLINCGGGDYVETTGRVRLWQADQYFTGGNDYTDAGDGIADTQNDPVRSRHTFILTQSSLLTMTGSGIIPNSSQLYNSERYGQFAYEIPVPIASYEVSRFCLVLPYIFEKAGSRS